MQEQKLSKKRDSKIVPQFAQLKSNNDLKEILQSAFDANLDISGSWGYTQALSTIIHSTDNTLPQFEHMFASMRAYIEMSMTQEEAFRYGSINLNELHREQLTFNSLVYDKVIYKISAIKESVYNTFINEYKEGYGQQDFDISAHFKRREEATLSREVTHWFEITQTLS
jgi:predicted small secreted protein